MIQDSGSTTLHCIGVKWSSMSWQLVLSKLISVDLQAGGERKVSILQFVMDVFTWCVTIATVMPGWKPRSWWYRALYTVIIYHLAGCMQRQLWHQYYIYTPHQVKLPSTFIRNLLIFLCSTSWFRSFIMFRRMKPAWVSSYSIWYSNLDGITRPCHYLSAPKILTEIVVYL